MSGALTELQGFRTEPERGGRLLVAQFVARCVLGFVPLDPDDLLINAVDAQMRRAAADAVDAQMERDTADLVHTIRHMEAEVRGEPYNRDRE